MALPITDAFTDTNGTTLPAHNANWVQNNGAFQIQSNKVQSNSGGAETCAHWVGDTFDNNQYAFITILANSTGDNGIGPSCRCAAGAVATYYGLYASTQGGGWLQLFKNITGTWTQFGSNDFGIAGGEGLRLEVNGTTLHPTRNGAAPSFGDFVDSAIPSGWGGVTGYSGGTAADGDNWEAGNLTVITYNSPAKIPRRLSLQQRVFD